MGAIDTIMNSSKTVIVVSEKLAKSIDSDRAKIIGDDLTKVSKAIKELDRKLNDGITELTDESEIIKSNIKEIENIDNEYNFLDELIPLFECDSLILELKNALKPRIMALKLGRTSSNFGVAGEILRGEV